MENYMPYIWVGIAVILAVVEGATAQLVSIWFVTGAIGALITSIFTNDILIQFSVFIVVSALALIVTRPFVKKMTKFKPVRTNSDKNIGRTGVVTIQINNDEGQGQVNVNGEKWTARTVDGSIAKQGETVVVECIEGVKLMVRQL